MYGKVDDKGQVCLCVELDLVSIDILLCDECICEYLFEIKCFVEVEIIVQFDLVLIVELVDGV